MEPVSTFSLRELPARHPEREHRRRLLLDGADTASVVSGDGLAAQYACGSRFLVVTHYDYLDGVSHWFHALDGRGRILDVVSPPDPFGFLQDVQVETPNRLHFGFYGAEDRWTITLLAHGAWSFRPVDLARRPVRHALGRRSLRLERA